MNVAYYTRPVKTQIVPLKMEKIKNYSPSSNSEDIQLYSVRFKCKITKQHHRNSNWNVWKPLISTVITCQMIATGLLSLPTNKQNLQQTPKNIKTVNLDLRFNWVSMIHVLSKMPFQLNLCHLKHMKKTGHLCQQPSLSKACEKIWRSLQFCDHKDS